MFILFLAAAVSYLVTGIVLGLKGPYLNGADATVEDLFKANTISRYVAMTSLGILLAGLIIQLTDLLASRSPLVSESQSSDA
jgi:H+/Cl- antiporter ClcA